MAFLERGRGRIYYEVAGSGPALVFAHGVGGNHASWFHQISTLSGRYRVVTWDHRGFGLSSDEEGLGRAGFIDDLVRLLDVLQLGRCVLIGQSMGGGTCLGVTCTLPDRVAGLVMADSLSAAELPQETGERLRATAQLTATLPQLERVLGPTTRRENPSAATLYSQLASFNATNLQTLQGKMPSFSAQQLAATGVRTLFIVGEEDVLFPPWAVRAYQRQVPASRIVELRGTGHSAFYERPDAFNAVLEDWLLEIGYAPEAGVD